MIGIVDYGLGNIKAFEHIYNKLNMDCIVASNVDLLGQADRLILPGVGSFDYAMMLLNRSGMRELLDDLVLRQKIPVLGICVGMQILAHSSEEGESIGLGYIDASVRKFQPEEIANNPLPHMGWNEVEHGESSAIFEGVKDFSRFYFLHSYYFSCKDESQQIGRARYGAEFTCAVQSKNIFGVQCHPEKSHDVGIQLLRNFGAI